MSNKNYRPSDPKIEYITVSLRLHNDVMTNLEKAVGRTDHHNMSIVIETIVSDKKVIETSKQRKHEGNTVKKTFTFTKPFYEKIKKSGNMSLFIENILKTVL